MPALTNRPVHLRVHPGRKLAIRVDNVRLHRHRARFQIERSRDSRNGSAEGFPREGRDGEDHGPAANDSPGFRFRNRHDQTKPRYLLNAH